MTETPDEQIEPNPDEVYDKFWAPIIEPDGQLDLNVLKQILFDYGATLHNLKILYGYITNYQITNPQAPIDKIMAASDTFVADTVDSGIQEILFSLIEESDWAKSQNLDPEQQLKHLNDSIDKLYEAGNKQ